MAAAGVPLPGSVIEGQVQKIFEELLTGFQKLDKIKNVFKQQKQLDELKGKMQEAKRFIKDFDQELKGVEANSNPELIKLVNEKKKSLIRELNTYIALRKTFTIAIGSKNDLLEGGSQARPSTSNGVRMASTMSNQELTQNGRKQMDAADKTIERSKKIVEDTMNIGAETATTLKGQTEQLGRIVNELDTIQFSIKKASKLVREIGKQMATDKCILAFLFLIVVGIVTVIIVKIVQSQTKKTSTTPSPSHARRLLMSLLDIDDH